MIFTVIAVLCATSIPQVGQAQRLYNKERDDQAQAALPLAKSLKSGELFDKQLKNFASLVKKDFETEFLVTKFQINAFTLGVLTWGSAHTQVCDIEARDASGKLPTETEIKDALAQLKTSIADAQTALDAFKKSIKAKGPNDEKEEDKDDRSVLGNLFNGLGELDSLQDFLEQVQKANPKAVDTKTLQSLQQVQDVGAELKKIYDVYTTKVKEFNKLEGQLGELRLVLKTVAIQSLQVDEDHWKNIAAIRARREIERLETLSLLKEYKGAVVRLGVVNYSPKDESQNFCQIVAAAENKSDGFNLWPQQMITVHLQDLVSLGESMGKNNSRIEDEAQRALKQMDATNSESDRRAAVAPTSKALEDAVKGIDDAHQTHKSKLEIRDQLAADSKTLDDAIKSSKEASKAALQSIIINAQKNRVTIRDMVGDIPQMLFIVAALIARGSTPTRLADLRLVQEMHAYSIRKSAVRARAYELTVSTGVQRLALFHAGGIKPTDVAELVFAASNIAITPAILAR